MFGISSKIYQHSIKRVLQGVPRVHNVSDDIISGGISDDIISRNISATSHAMSARETADSQQQEVPIPDDTTGIHGSCAVKK